VNVRSRALPLKEGSAHSKVKDTFFSTNDNSWHDRVLADNTVKYKFTGTQITESEGHPFRSRTGIGDVGGPFYTQKKYIRGSIPDMQIRLDVENNPTNHRVYSYDGLLLPVSPDAAGNLPFPVSNSSSDSELNAAGATAIARFNPTSPIVSLSTDLGELLSDGLPHLIGSYLWKERISAAQKAGSEYLNYQFGWAPLISDLKKFTNFMKNVDTVLTQYERDSGRVVRRRGDLSSTDSVTETTNFPVQPWAPPAVNRDFLGSGGHQVRRSRTTRHRWFSGAFTYYLPTGYDSRSEMDRIRLIADRIGLSPSPDTLWNLAPWSWAVDWFSNAGDVVANIDSFKVDGTVLAYGYLMEHTIASDTYTINDMTYINGSHCDVRPLTLITETKKRIAASPYGFGVSWDGLSSFQASILTALGLTKGRR